MPEQRAKTGRRVRVGRVFKAPLIIGLTLALVIIMIDAFLWSIVDSSHVDFSAFVYSGQAVAAERSPYERPADTPALRRMFSGYDWLPNLNPPLLLPIFEAIAGVDLRTGYHAWYAISLALYAGVIVWLLGVYRHHRRPLVVLWLFAITPIWSTLHLGQVYMPLAAAVVGAWFLLPRRPAWAGVLIGIVVAVKPNFAAWAGLLLVAGCWRPVITAVLSAGALSAIPLVVYGADIYREWIDASRQADLLDTLSNASVFGLAARLGIAWIALPLSAALVGICIGWVRRCRPAVQQVSGVGLVMSLVISPLAWPGYVLFLLPVFLARRWSVLVTLSAAIFVLPVAVVYRQAEQSHAHFVFFGLWYGVALLILLAALLREPVRGNAAAPAV